MKLIESPKEDKMKKEKKIKSEKKTKSETEEKKEKKKSKKTDVTKEEKTKKEKKVKKAEVETNGVNGTCKESSKNGETISEEKELSPQEKAGAFSNFNLGPNTIKKLKANGITYLFPVQSETFDIVYSGEDLITQARTGTGKTLAFALPVIEKLQKDKTPANRGRPPKVLVMAPTRELAKQVADDFLSYSTSLVVLTVYGGTPYRPQMDTLRSGTDVVVGTPGRINDLIEKGALSLTQLRHVILDEVDSMLDMGFVEIVESILSHAYTEENKEGKPQTLLFTATLPPWVRKSANKYMDSGVKTIDLIGRDFNKTSKTVEHLAIKCNYSERASILGDIVACYSGTHGRAMIFCQTKREADELAISPHIKVEGHVLHGDIPQEKRESVLKGFREGKYKVLITTDVAARGLDIPEVDIVVQCEPSKYADAYIHRSGRTGRAGRKGICVCLYSAREMNSLRKLEYQAGITFKKTGPPTPDELVKAASDDALRALDNMKEDTIQHFIPKAEELIQQRGASKALAAALAVISNSSNIDTRSYITAKKGFTTYICQTNMELFGPGYVWRFLEEHFPEVKEKAESMILLQNKKGCAFDIPSDLADHIGESYEGRNGVVLSKATELPQLKAAQSYGGGGYGGGGGSSGRGRFGGRGGGGFRGNSGRFGGRGGGFKRSASSSGFQSSGAKRGRFF